MELTSGVKPLPKQRGEINAAVIGLMAAGCFFVSRSMLLGGTFPAGIALAAVFVSRSSLHFYLLPASLLGVLSCLGQSSYIWGDMTAIAACAVFFLCTAKIKFALWHKSVIAAAICITANCSYYIGAHILYKLSIQNLWLEAMIVAVLCPCFDMIAGLIKKEPRQFEADTGMAAVTALAILVLLGTGLEPLAVPGAMAIILYLGYTNGVAGGVAAGFLAGILMLLSGGGTAEITVFMVGGMTAGFSKGQNRFAAGACFAAASMAPGLLDLGINLALPCYYPLAAAMVFWILPKRWIRQADIALGHFLQRGRYYEKEKEPRRQIF